MKILIYWILRLVLVGLGIGTLMFILIDKSIGIGWILGYTLCWSFSFINRNKNISKLEEQMEVQTKMGIEKEEIKNINLIRESKKC